MPLVVTDCDTYVRVEVHGVLATGIAREATPEDVAIISRANRFLLDLAGVTDITANALVLAVQPRTRTPRPVRISVFAPNALAFGWTRQLLLAGDADPERVGVFRDEESALEWLRASPANER